jgi:predicted XRE-type DNA-binding protein
MATIPRAENVFAVIGCDNPEALLLKAQLMTAVLNQVRAMEATQAPSISSLGLSADQLAKLLQEDFNAFSLDEMVELAARIQIRLEITCPVHAS